MHALLTLFPAQEGKEGRATAQCKTSLSILVYETDLSVRTKIEELPTLLEFTTAAGISEFWVHLEELNGRMKPICYGPTEPRLGLVGNIPLRTWGSCRGTSERKAQTHSYDDLIDPADVVGHGEGE